jgi:sugar lactone lactonase YvrE
MPDQPDHAKSTESIYRGLAMPYQRVAQDRGARELPEGTVVVSEDNHWSLTDDILVEILRVDVEAGAEEVAIQLTEGSGPDGFAFDRDGNIVIAAIANEGERGSIQTWSTDGKMVDILHPGNSRAYSNVAFTPDRDLVITDASGGQAIIAVGFGDGLPLHPFR